MINPASVLRSWNELSLDCKQLVNLFLSPDANGLRYVMGRNETSAALIETVDIEGFVDDFAVAGSSWAGKPVFKGTDIPAAAVVVNCSMSIWPRSAHERIQRLGLRAVQYVDLCKAFPEKFQLPDFISASREDILNHQTAWEAISDRLADAESREVLDSVIRYRLTGDCEAMKYDVRLEEQYFEDFLQLGPGEVFVDAGGFDGDTTEIFCKRCPAYEKVFLFEPSSENIVNARQRLSQFRSVQFIEKAVSDVAGVLWFHPDKGSASYVSNTGSVRVEVTTLDEEIPTKFTFVKMDLEGWELKALAGSQRHILEDHPKLAIAVYHRPSDFWRTFEYVLGLRHDYDVYLRHYTEGWSETVMFFVPAGSLSGLT